jgi:hypothetical protein
MGTLHRLDVSHPARGGRELDRELEVGVAVLLGLLWIASVARVVAASSQREVFGVEASLAFVCMLALPWFAFRRFLRRRARRAGRHEVIGISSLPRHSARSKRGRCGA